METLVLIKSNFRDENDHKPIATSDNKDWLLELIPDDFVEMDDEFIPTYTDRKSGEYYEIRVIEKLIKKPYKEPILENLTKKRFKELASVHVYGRGERRRVRLFFDWCNDFDRGIGYKYMLKGYGCTKATILKDGYDILIKKDNAELCWYDTKEAKTDAERFKVPISG